MTPHEAEIDRLKALGPERTAALTQEVLGSMAPWLLRLLRSTDPYRSRILRANVLKRSGLRQPPTPSDDPQLKLVHADEKGAG